VEVLEFSSWVAVGLGFGLIFDDWWGLGFGLVGFVVRDFVAGIVSDIADGVAERISRR